VHRPTFDAYPQDLQASFRTAAADAVAFQRKLAIEEDAQARKAIVDAGGEIVTLSAAEHESFVAAVKPIYRESGQQHGALLELARAI